MARQVSVAVVTELVSAPRPGLERRNWFGAWPALQSCAHGDEHIAQPAADGGCQWVATTHRDRLVSPVASPSFRGTDVMLVPEYQ